MSDDYKKYDSEDNYECVGVRLAKDAETRAGGKMTILTFVSTSKSEGDADMWVEAIMSDYYAEAAAWLKKGDVVHKVFGKPCRREYNGKVSFQLRRAGVIIPISLKMVLKEERGFTPSGKGNATSSKPAARTKRDPLDDDSDIPL